MKLKYLKHENTGIKNMSIYALWMVENGRKIAKRLGTNKITIIYDRKDHFKNKFNRKALNEARKLV